MNWLEELVDDRKDFETPLSFWKWAGLATISAIVKDSVWLHRQLYDLYPNVYVMFHADSGLKKGPPVNLAARLVKLVNNTRVISGRSSIQGILKELGTAQTEPGGKINKKAVAFICSSELSSSIVDDPVATTILTDLYDRQYRVGEWRSLLKMESFDLKDPTLTMLTATNEAHSDSFFESKDVKGGFFARTFVVYESEENRSNSLLVPLTKPIDINKNADYLRQLSRLSGAFQPLASRNQEGDYTEEYKDRATGEAAYFTKAGFIYQRWYDEFKVLIKTSKDPTGTLNRFGDSVLKVAMLLSLAREPCLVISEEAMNEAIEISEKLIGNIRRTTLGKIDGLASDSTRKTTLIFELMARDNHAISRQQINKKFFIQGTPQEWDTAIESFVASGMCVAVSVGNQIVVEMTPEAVREYTRFFGGK